jgi:hypothetical protein
MAATLIDFAAICMALKLCTCRECCAAIHVCCGCHDNGIHFKPVSVPGRRLSAYLQKVLVVDGAG